MDKMSRLDNLDALEREELLYLASLAEQTERYDDMVLYASALVTKYPTNPSYAEQQLLSAAYKGTVESLRHALNVLDRKTLNPSLEHIIKAYRTEIKYKLLDVCTQVLTLIDNRLLGQTGDIEIRVKYRKMRADYTSTKSYYMEGELKEEMSQRALSMYQDANNEAENCLLSISPLRLALGLSYSVHCALVRKDVPSACRIAKDVFEDAMQSIDIIDEETYKAVIPIMQMIRNNLLIWTDEETSETIELSASWSL